MGLSISKKELRSAVIEFYTSTGRSSGDEMEINFLIECAIDKDYRHVVMQGNDNELITLVTEFAAFLKSWFRVVAVKDVLNDK